MAAAVLGNTWLVVVARPTRLIPRSAPRLDRETALQIVDDARKNPVAIFDLREHVLGLLGNGLAHITVGLNAWVVTNRASIGVSSLREVAVELHHDGGLVFVVNLSRPIDRIPPHTGVVNVDVVEQACVELEGLLLYAMRAERIDSPMRVQASVVSENEYPLGWARRTAIGFEHAQVGYRPHRLRPITVEVPAGAIQAAVVDALTRGSARQMGSS